MYLNTLILDNKIIPGHYFIANMVFRENPYIESSLYHEFFILISFNLLEFNYNYFISEYNLETSDESLDYFNLKLYILYHLLSKFQYTHLLNTILLNKSFFTDSIFYLDLNFK